MVRRDTPRGGMIDGHGPGREGVRDLLRRPMVQLLLGLAALGQVVAIQHDPERLGRTAREVAAVLQPVVVAPDAARAAARAGEAEAGQLAAEYRQKGYPVTPELAQDIHAAAVENGIDPEIAFGLVRAESSFRNTSTSRVGAVGLTQLMPQTARWLEPGTTRSELRDPETNLRIGLKYLRQLIDKYQGDVDLALTAYNRGPGTVDRALKRGRNPDNGYADFVKSGNRGRHRG